MSLEIYGQTFKVKILCVFTQLGEGASSGLMKAEVFF